MADKQLAAIKAIVRARAPARIITLSLGIWNLLTLLSRRPLPSKLLNVPLTTESSNEAGSPGANPDVRHAVTLSRPATAESFDEVGYLDANPDVRKAVEAGHFSSGRQHFDLHGHRE